MRIEDRGYEKGVCWIWEKAINNNGYGVTSNGPKLAYVHRLSYQEFRGLIPAGLTIDHLCRVRCCLNPNHLEAVTKKENTARGLGVGAINAAKTHCPKKHELSGENLYITPAGSRNCVTCKKESFQAWYARQKKGS